jgi:hypothetical protein
MEALAPQSSVEARLNPTVLSSGAARLGCLGSVRSLAHGLSTLKLILFLDSKNRHKYTDTIQVSMSGTTFESKCSDRVSPA